MSRIFVNSIVPNSGDTIVVHGDLRTTGKLTIGDHSGDSVDFNADVESNIIPNQPNSYSLGNNTGKYWRSVYASTGSFNHLHDTFGGEITIGNGASIVPQMSSSGLESLPTNLGSNSSSFNTLFTNNIYTQNQETSPLTISASLEVFINASKIRLGGSGSYGDPRVIFGAKISSSIIPHISGIHDLGSHSNYWENTFTDHTNTNRLNALTTNSITSSAHIIPLTPTLTLGNEDNAWSRIHANNINTTNITASGDIVPSGSSASIGSVSKPWNALHTTNISSSVVSASTRIETNLIQTSNDVLSFKSGIGSVSGESLKKYLFLDENDNAAFEINQSGYFVVGGPGLFTPRFIMRQNMDAATGSTSPNSSGTPIFQFERESTSHDGSPIGRIDFRAMNANSSSIETYARVTGLTEETDDGSEGGKLELQVASHDGEMKSGLTITDGNAEDEVDVIIGNGPASTTTVSGSLNTLGTGIFGNGITTSNISASRGGFTHITASGAIISSGNITAPQFIGTASYASTASVALGLTDSPNIDVNRITALGPITASGAIISSGNITAPQFIGTASYASTASVALGLTDSPNIDVNRITALGSITSSGEIRGAALIISGNADLGASVDAVHCGSLTGQKFTVKNQLQGAIADGDTSALFTVGNTSINTDSVIYGTLNGITTLIGGLSQSSLNVHVNANNSMSFCFTDAEGGETIADDTPFTASFVVF